MPTLSRFEIDARQKLREVGIKRLTRESLKWFENEIGQTTLSRATYAYVKDFGVSRTPPLIQPGQMIFYGYDPKYKLTLPLYDRFPLVLVTSVSPTGWTGINFHYLPPEIRTRIMAGLLESRSRDRIMRDHKMAISWKYATRIGRRVGQSKALGQSVKQYLRTHVKTVPVVIDADQWDMIIYLPLARFAKGKPY